MTARPTIQKSKGASIFQKMLDDKKALQEIAITATSTEDYLKKVKAFNKKRKAVVASI